MQKLKDVLSDEESMRQIEELAQMFSSQVISEEQQSCAESIGSMPDMAVISGLLGAFSSQSGNGNNKNTALLLALKEHLSPERQDRIDRAIKLMRLVDIVKTAKESGLLENLI